MGMYLKPIKNKTCKACSDEFTPRATTQTACSPICAIALAKVKEQKKLNREQNKEHRLRKKIFYANDLKTRKLAAVKACHEYIRERDKNKGCITCGTDLKGKKFDAGHFIKSTYSFTKFMEKNIHGQCVACNQYNGGEELKYYQSLFLKYGELTTKALMRCKWRKVKRTCEDYKEIEKYYKDKLKALAYTDNIQNINK